MDETYEYRLRFVITGPVLSGKSSFFERFTKNTFKNKYMPTIGVEFAEKLINFEGKSIKIQLWDSNGDQRFMALYGSYYEEADAVLIILDVTERENLNILYRHVEKIVSIARSKDVIIVVGNKIDRVSEREFNFEMAQELTSNLGISYMEASACTGENIENIFKLAVKKAMVKISNSE